MIRSGIGYDLHTFGSTKPLILGGIEFDYQPGLVAHSDGDVVIHALCDALLGALGLGDIGEHFSDQDPQYADTDSGIFLQKIVALMHEHKYELNNCDLSIITEAPKLSPYKPAMRAKLAALLNVEVDQVNVKATTNEKIGAISRGEGIACIAVVSLIDKQLAAKLTHG